MEIAKIYKDNLNLYNKALDYYLQILKKTPLTNK